MRLMRGGPIGQEIPIVVDGDGVAHDVTSIVGGDLTARTLDDGALDRLTDSDPSDLPVVDLDGMRVGPPVGGIGKIVCVGLNYREHARETGQPEPSEPILFLKASDTVVGPDDDVLIPLGSTKTDYEVELAVVIGRTARYLGDDADPLDHVAGYAISNDVSEREFQMERGGQWDKGKNAETFNPFGPVLVTRDEIADVQTLDLSSSVNGEVRQTSTTADMIFPVAELVRYISQFMVLYPGDVINTGTPQGVGSGFAPPRFVHDGDVVELTIAGLGHQRQQHRAARMSA